MVKSSSGNASGLQLLRDRLLRWLPPLTSLRQQFNLLRWLIPMSLVLVVVLYEIGPSRWIFERFGFTFHMLAEIVLFATVGPAVVYFVLDILVRWLDERDTSDYQAKLLALARDDAERSRRRTDDALQLLFGATVLLDNIKSDCPELPPNMTAEIDSIEEALNDSIQDLRSHLLD